MNERYPLMHKIRPGDNLYHLAKYYQTTVPMILSMNPNIDPYNLQVGSTIAIRPGRNYNNSNNGSRPSINCAKHIKLTNDMRLVWEQHIYWTRMLLISIAERLKDQTDVANHLLQNPENIANVFSSYYTTDATELIAELLTEHLEIGAELITALRDGETAKAQTLDRQWYQNADKMADAFSSLNPYYNREELRTMLYTHLDLTKQEVAMRLAGNYKEDIKAFDKIEQEVLLMADYFTEGIIKQFPNKFT